MRETLKVIQPADLARQLARDTAVLEAADLDASSHGLPLLLATLASGRFDRVQRLLRTAASAATLPLIAGRYAAWTGDLVTLAGVWQQVRDAAANLDPEGGPVQAVLAVAGLAALQRTATDLGDPQLAAALIGRERRARARLETIDLTPEAALLARATGLHPPAPEATDDTTAAALRILHFTHHVLGVEPDASRQRLRLRPRLLRPGRLDVGDIGFADATLALQLELHDNGLACRVAQQSGALPLTLILEPVLPAQPASATVDGQSAELSPRRDGADLVLPVQLVLDAERSLAIRFKNEGPPT